MSFPTSPSNGQIVEVDDIFYVYNSTTGAWEVQPSQTAAEVTFSPDSWGLGETPTNTKDALDILSQAGLFSASGVNFLGFFDPFSPPTAPASPGVGDAYQVSQDGPVVANFPSDTNIDIPLATVVVEGDLIRWNGTAWIVISVGAGSGATLLNELTDVVISTLGSGQTLRYNGVFWANAPLDYSDLDGVPPVPVNLGDLADWPASFNDLSDVNASINDDSLLYKQGTYRGSGSHIAGDLIYFDGTDWVALRPPSTPASPVFLGWNGTAYTWVDADDIANNGGVSSGP